MPDTAYPPELQLENQLCFAVYSTSHAFAQAYKPLLEPLGLTYPQYLVMLLLWEKDGRSVNELSAPLRLDSGTLTPLLKRMEKAGFVTRQRDAKDERITRIHLTAIGKALRGKAVGVPAAIMCATDLVLDDLIALRDRVREVGDKLRRALASPLVRQLKLPYTCGRKQNQSQGTRHAHHHRPPYGYNGVCLHPGRSAPGPGGNAHSRPHGRHHQEWSRHRPPYLRPVRRASRPRYL